MSKLSNLNSLNPKLKRVNKGGLAKVSNLFRICYLLDESVTVSFKKQEVKVKDFSLIFIPPKEEIYIKENATFLVFEFDIYYNDSLINNIEGDLSYIKVLDNLGFINVLMPDILGEIYSRSDYFELKAEGVLKILLAMVLESLSENTVQKKGELIAYKVIKYLNLNFKENISNKTLGEKFGYHPNHLNRIMLNFCGQTIHKYILNCKINAAQELLKNTTLSLKEIAEQLGFRDAAHFSKSFKLKTGKTPKEVRLRSVHSESI